MIVDIVFDAPPGHVSGCFVDAEDASGRGVKVGDWIDRKDGYWALRLNVEDPSWKPIATAPKTGPDLKAKEFLAWCPDPTAPRGGDRRICWWEPLMKDGVGCWWGDEDHELNPTRWTELPGVPDGAK